MHQTQSRSGKAKYIKRKKGLVSSLKGVSHLFVHAKRRSYCRLQLWMWRKWREKWGFGVIRAKKNGCGLKLDRCLHLRASSQKNKRKIPAIRHTDLHASTSAALSTLVCDSEIKEETLRGQNHLLNPHGVSQYSAASRSSPNQLTDTNGPAGAISKTMPSQRGETTGQVIKTAKPSKRSHAVNPVLSTASEACGGNMRFPSGQYTTVEPDQDKDERLTNKKASHADVSFKALTTEIHEFLDEFYRIYGSFTPLQKSDLLRYLKRKFNVDFSDSRKNFIFSEVTRYRNATAQTPVPRFRVVYKKHTLSLDDLSTLADQNWLNDQVMNMYGELIVESAHHKVHFLNSFFHRQLMTKGYDGVKRWTKQVDLFSKSLLLVPVHLVVHWCLVTADFVRKKICLYDSQGHALQKVARNILKYLMAEAKEKQQTAFENGWTVSFDEKIPQQTNENDCGVFVLEYSRCLALEQPLQFSQDDIPNIRKRIYKELCDCKLHEEGKTKM